MIAIFQELILFVETGIPSGSLVSLTNGVKAADLRLCAMVLLEWLKTMNRCRHKEALELYKDVEWCTQVRGVMSAIPQFKTLFAVSEQQIDFAPAITPEVRDEIRAFVDKNYNPRIMR